MPKQIVICDDHILFLNGIFEILTKADHSYHILKFNDAASCKAYLLQHETDVFICDLNINNVDGFVLLEELKYRLKKTKIIILTAYYEDFLIQKAKRMGATAFLKKETSAEELIQVINAEPAKEIYVNGVNTKRVSLYQTMDNAVVNKFRISKQEKEVIKLIIKGLTSKEIADVLFVSKTTIDSHRKNIYKKLEISNSSSLVTFAYENNLLS